MFTLLATLDHDAGRRGRLTSVGAPRRYRDRALERLTSFPHLLSGLYQLHDCRTRMGAHRPDDRRADTQLCARHRNRHRIPARRRKPHRHHCPRLNRSPFPAARSTPSSPAAPVNSSGAPALGLTVLYGIIAITIALVCRPLPRHHLLNGNSPLPHRRLAPASHTRAPRLPPPGGTAVCCSASPTLRSNPTANGTIPLSDGWRRRPSRRGPRTCTPSCRSSRSVAASLRAGP